MDTQKNRFEVYISDLVSEEAGKGDITASAKRLNALSNIPVFSISDEVIILSEKLVDEGILPTFETNEVQHL